MMCSFCDCETSSIAATLAATYDLPCVIKRNNGTQGSLGYQSGNWSIVAPLNGDTLNCSMKTPSAGILSTYSGQIGSQATWQVRLPLNTDVQAEDVLIVKGQTLTVQAILEPQSYDFEINLLASQIKGQVSDGG